MSNLLAVNWWAIVLRGALAVLFGLLTFIVPGASLFGLVFLFGAYALIEGIFNVVAAVRGIANKTHWAALLVEGLISIGAGLLTFLWPGITALALVYVIAGWALATGVLEIAAAVRLRKQIHGEWMLALTGVLSIGLGVVLAAFPGAGAYALTLWIGVYAVFFGALLILLGFRIHSWDRTVHHPMHPLAGT